MTTREWDHRRHGRDRVDARKEFATECACRCGSRCAIEIFPRPSSGGCPRKNLTSRGAPTSRMGMTTVWRPRVRIDVPDVGDAENTDTSREESTKKGTKRKRAPPTKGPCEHGVKTRSKCKVCSRLSARSSAPSVQGVRWGMQSASTVVVRSHCKECGGASICEHGRQRHRCKECGGSQSASTVVSAHSARSAVGHGICEHGRVRSSARSAAGHQSASTVVCALSARSAVGHQSASTVVSAITARSVVVQESASTVVGAIDARSVLD